MALSHSSLITSITAFSVEVSSFPSLVSGILNFFATLSLIFSFCNDSITPGLYLTSLLGLCPEEDIFTNNSVSPINSLLQISSILVFASILYERSKSKNLSAAVVKKYEYSSIIKTSIIYFSASTFRSTFVSTFLNSVITNLSLNCLIGDPIEISFIFFLHMSLGEYILLYSQTHYYLDSHLQSLNIDYLCHLRFLDRHYRSYI